MKERIQQKAHDLFRRYGIKPVTMDEIAAQLGVSKKTIYQYYSDKDELVEAVTKEMIRFSTDCCEKDRSTAQNAIHEVFQAMEFVQEIFSNMNPAMLFELERYHSKAYRVFLEHKNKYLMEMIRTNLERGIKEGLYRPEIRVDLLSKFRLESMMLLFDENYFPRGKYNLATVHKEIMEHFLFGLSSLKGYKLILKYQQERKKTKQSNT